MLGKRDPPALERRRTRAAAMFNKGYSPAGVARRIGLSRQSAGRWKAAWERGGWEQLASKGRAGRKPRPGAAQREQVTAALIAGPLAQGYQTDSLDPAAGRSFDQGFDGSESGLQHAPSSGANAGFARTEPGDPGNLRLEKSPAHCRHPPRELLLSNSSRSHPRAAGGPVPARTPAARPWPAADPLGGCRPPPQQTGLGFCGERRPTVDRRTFARLCAGTQPGGMPLGSPQRA